MKTCKNCNHRIRKINGVWLHRKEHSKYSGIGGTGGVTFNKLCANLTAIDTMDRCKCVNPSPQQT